MVKELLIDILRTRIAENYIRENYKYNEMKSPMHMSMGDEAAVAGVVNATREFASYFAYYRSHSPYICVTRDLMGFFLELYGKMEAPNGGRAGSMHICNPEKGLILTSAVVSSTIAPAVGAAFTYKYTEQERYAVCFFGDGAMEQGVFWESMNIASLHQLPVIFVCLDNDLAVDVEAKDRRAFRSIKEIVGTFDISYKLSDSTDALSIYELTRSAVIDSGQSRGPLFLHLKYYRLLQHIGVEDDFQRSVENPDNFERSGYRSRADLEAAIVRDPSKIIRERFLCHFSKNELDKIDSDLSQELVGVIDYVKGSASPTENDIFTYI